VRWSTWQSTPERIAEFSKHRANWAVRTGCDYGLVVLDVDRYKPGADERLAELGISTETPTVLTPSGGEQYYFKANGKRLKSREILPGIDLKAEGGLVLIPPSAIDGKSYEFEAGYSITDLPLADLPQEIIDHAEEKAEKPKRHSGAKLEGSQKEALESTLMEYLPGARWQGREIAGYTEESKSKAHIKVNLDKGPGVFMDWHREEGGTIVQLLKQLGAPIPQELEDMGKPGIPEYMPIWILRWILGPGWQRKYKCGDPVTLVRKDGKPILSGQMFGLTWGCCDGCRTKLKNIQKAELRQEPLLGVVKAEGGKEEIQKKLKKLKRKYHEIEYKRWRGDGREWIIFKDKNVPNVIKTRFAEKELEAIESEFGSIYDITDAEIDRMVEDLAIADTKRKQHRVSSSRNFHSKQHRRGNTNENKNKEDKNKEKSVYNIENIESNGRDTPKYDMVVLKGNYQELLRKLRERAIRHWTHPGR